MAVTIADLDVNIRTTGGGAASALEELISKLDQLIAALNGTSTSGKGATSTIRGMGSSLKSAGSSAKYANTGLAGFFRQVKRIATYRLIRTALRGIINGFREGIQNIAQYSAAMNGLDANKANSVMSAYATMGAQIKNSLGAAIMPMLVSLLPTVQKLADAFLDGADAVARFFATLNGQSTYTAVNRDYMVDYAAKLNKANQSAKELKNTILGFDEINALQKQSSGDNSNAVDYSKMFVEAENNWLGLKDKFEWYLITAEAIGAALLTWRISAGLLAGLESGMTLAMGIKNALMGLVGLAISIYFSIGAGEDFAEGDIKGGLSKMILGTLSGALGGAYLGSFAGGKGILVGALVGVGISLVTTVVSFIANKSKADRKEWYDTVIAPQLRQLGIDPTTTSDEGIAARLQVTLDVETKIKSLTGEIDSETIAKHSIARDLINEIFDLDAIENKLPETIELIKNKIEVLNGLNLNGIYLQWDNLKGVIGGTKDELLAIVDALDKEARIAAVKNDLVEAYAAIWDSRKEYEQAIRDMRGLSAAGDYEGVRELGYVANNAYQNMVAAARSYARLLKMIDPNATVDLSKLIEISEDVANSDLYQPQGGFLGDTITSGINTITAGHWQDDFSKAFQASVEKGWNMATQEMRFTAFSNGFINAFDRFWDGTEANFEEALSKAIYDATTDGISKADLEKFGANLKERINSIIAEQGVPFAEAVKLALPEALKSSFGDYDFTSFVKRMIEELEIFSPELASSLATAFAGALGNKSKTLGETIAKAIVAPFTSGNILTFGINFQTKATGGYVPSGDLFWAGERGAEIITTAPGGSEVINEAQFERMVMNAVAMAGGGGGGDWTIVVQDESGNERSRQVITAAERANRRDGRTIIPVGVS